MSETKEIIMGDKHVHQAGSVMVKFVQYNVGTKQHQEAEGQQGSRQQTPPQQAECEEPSRSKTLRDCFVEGVNQEQCIERMRRLLEGQKGKRVAIVVHCAMLLGWFIEEPKFALLQEEFGELGSKQAYRKQFNCRQHFTPEETEPILKALSA